MIPSLYMIDRWWVRRICSSEKKRSLVQKKKKWKIYHSLMIETEIPSKLEFLMGATTPMVIFHVILKCKIQNRFVINIRLTKA